MNENRKPGIGVQRRPAYFAHCLHCLQTTIDDRVKQCAVAVSEVAFSLSQPHVIPVPRDVTETTTQHILLLLFAQELTSKEPECECESPTALGNVGIKPHNEVVAYVWAT